MSQFPDLDSACSDFPWLRHTEDFNVVPVPYWSLTSSALDSSSKYAGGMVCCLGLIVAGNSRVSREPVSQVLHLDPVNSIRNPFSRWWTHANLKSPLMRLGIMVETISPFRPTMMNPYRVLEQKISESSQGLSAVLSPTKANIEPNGRFVGLVGGFVGQDNRSPRNFSQEYQQAVSKVSAIVVRSLNSPVQIISPPKHQIGETQVYLNTQAKQAVVIQP